MTVGRGRELQRLRSALALDDIVTNTAGRPLPAAHDVVIREMACRERGAAHGWLCGGQTPSLVLVRRGAFVLQAWDARAARSIDAAEHVVDPCNALILWDHAQYRVRHPCGEAADCLQIELGAHLAADRLRGLCRDRDLCVPLSPRLQRAVAMVTAAVPRCELARLAQAAVELIDAITDAARTPSHRRAGQGKPRALAARRLTVAAIAQIHRDLSINRSIADLADELGCSPFHLMHAFRAEVGDTLRAYRLRARLGVALHLLAQGHDDLCALAIDLGFASHSHLTDTFARELGVSPSRLRAQLHEPDRPRTTDQRAGA